MSLRSGDRGGPSPDPVTVFVVDQHPVWCAGLRATFARYADLRVIGDTATASEVVPLVTRHRPAVVLLDPTIRGANRPVGLELCGTLRSRCPDSRVLVLSPVRDERCVIASMEAGACGYFDKDVAVEQLVTAVRSVAAGRRALDRRSAAVLMGAGPATDTLTGRQLEVLRLLARGMSNRDIAGALTVSEGTVKFHLAKIMRRLDVPGRAAAVYAASRQGLI